MSPFRRKKPGRTGIRAALLAGATVAAVAVAGIGAGSASAAVSCTGVNITGEGSSLQKIAQQNVWIPTFQNEICNSGTHPTVTYLPEGSGAGLKAWAANTGNPEEFKRTRQFVGTDDAPTAAQITNIKTAAGGGDVLTVPVAQTSIAVVVNPPEGCTVTKMTGKDVERSFRGVDKKWSEISTATGGAACESAITRVVRFDGSGTTYQFKNYLSLYNSAALPCIGKTWKEIEPIENTETSAPNTSWPEGCNGIAAVVRPAAKGGGEVVKKVNATAGSIGYASLPDAQANSGKLVELQNNGQSTSPTYGSPVLAGETAGKGVANCGGIQYIVPKEARNGGVVLNSDWSQVFGAVPSVGGSFYPLCTLTYDLAFHGYKAAGFKFNEEVTVQDLLEGYLVFKGQEDLVTTETNYAPLPEVKTNGTFNVLAAARRTAAKIQP